MYYNPENSMVIEVNDQDFFALAAANARSKAKGLTGSEREKISRDAWRLVERFRDVYIRITASIFEEEGVQEDAKAYFFAHPNEFRPSFITSPDALQTAERRASLLAGIGVGFGVGVGVDPFTSESRSRSLEPDQEATSPPERTELLFPASALTATTTTTATHPHPFICRVTSAYEHRLDVHVDAVGELEAKRIKDGSVVESLAVSGSVALDAVKDVKHFRSNVLLPTIVKWDTKQKQWVEAAELASYVSDEMLWRWKTTGKEFRAVLLHYLGTPTAKSHAEYHTWLKLLPNFLAKPIAYIEHGLTSLWHSLTANWMTGGPKEVYFHNKIWLVPKWSLFSDAEHGEVAVLFEIGQVQSIDQITWQLHGKVDLQWEYKKDHGGRQPRIIRSIQKLLQRRLAATLVEKSFELVLDVLLFLKVITSSEAKELEDPSNPGRHKWMAWILPNHLLQDPIVRGYVLRLIEVKIFGGENPEYGTGLEANLHLYPLYDQIKYLYREVWKLIGEPSVLRPEDGEGSPPGFSSVAQDLASPPLHHDLVSLYASERAPRSRRKTVIRVGPKEFFLDGKVQVSAVELTIALHADPVTSPPDWKPVQGYLPKIVPLITPCLLRHPQELIYAILKYPRSEKSEIWYGAHRFIVPHSLIESDASGSPSFSSFSQEILPDGSSGPPVVPGRSCSSSGSGDLLIDQAAQLASQTSPDGIYIDASVQIEAKVKQSDWSSETFEIYPDDTPPALGAGLSSSSDPRTLVAGQPVEDDQPSEEESSIASLGSSPPGLFTTVSFLVNAYSYDGLSWYLLEPRNDFKYIVPYSPTIKYVPLLSLFLPKNDEGVIATLLPHFYAAYLEWLKTLPTDQSPPEPPPIEGGYLYKLLPPNVHIEFDSKVEQLKQFGHRSGWSYVVRLMYAALVGPGPVPPPSSPPEHSPALRNWMTPLAESNRRQGG